MKILAVLVFGLLLFAGCIGDSPTVKDVNDDPDLYLGEKITLKGVVTNSFKFGKLSGFKLKDEGETLLVSSDMLPAEGSEVYVEGTLMRDSLVGYYLLTKDIRET